MPGALSGPPGASERAAPGRRAPRSTMQLTLSVLIARLTLLVTIGTGLSALLTRAATLGPLLSLTIIVLGVLPTLLTLVLATLLLAARVLAALILVRHKTP